MLFHEQFWRIEERSRKMRFRKRWSEVAWQKPTIELDFAYFVVAAWLPVVPNRGLAGECQSIWRRTVQLMDNPSFWNRISCIAMRLLHDHEILDATDIAESMVLHPE
jgi:hypothetical protein